MVPRRGFLAGLLAASLAPVPCWAEAGAPAVLAAAKLDADRFALLGLGGDLTERFRLSLPERGHAGAAHPRLPQAVVFARRPGTFALVLDCRDGALRQRLTAPEGRHFYGHGAFSADGGLLFTTENDFAQARGVIGVWDVAAGYRRVAEWDSGGVGPHEILRLPGGDRLAVANGGIATEPSRGREKLNLDTMRPNLTILAPDGRIETRDELDPALRRNSIRHLAVRADGTLAFAMQWEGSEEDLPPLLGLRAPGGQIRLLAAPDPVQWATRNYAGSVAFSGDGTRLAITAPRGDALHLFDPDTGAFLAAETRADICGLCPAGNGLIWSTGTGQIQGPAGQTWLDLAFDNHLVAVPLA